MKPVVYVETTIPSYLTSAPSRDLVVAANQQVTHTWWRTAGERYELVVSEYVLREIRSGDPVLAERRLALVERFPVLAPTAAVQDLTEIYGRRLGLSGRAASDIPHLAYAVAYNVRSIVTWNLSHLANERVIARLEKLNRELGLETPLITTPQVLLGSDEEE